ncbi:MAG: MBL fold metallo-hydrolase [Deltaproteobacteria bacterium]|nr:MBL fold metallo-hydrolase [Deltaproteobacteria bacterium]
MTISLRFWGVRGSVPAPGPETSSYGGNTSCVEISCDDEVVILDGGTGLRRLGDDLRRRDADRVEASILFSHVHWDHIQGVPFFSPLFRSSTSLRMYGAPEGGSIEEMLERQMTSPNFPVALDNVPASLGFEAVSIGEQFEIGSFSINSSRLHHPSGCIAYRVEAHGCSIVYATDTEPLGDGVLDEDLIRLAKGADVLIHDAQYTEAEYRGDDGISRHGWGHSTWQDAVRVARAAEVSKLILFHHDPARDDDAVADLERAAYEELPGTIAAREDLEIQLQSCLHRRAA